MSEYEILEPDNHSPGTSLSPSEEKLVTQILAKLKDQKPNTTLSSVSKHQMIRFIVDYYNIENIVQKFDQQLHHVNIISRDLQINILYSNDKTRSFPDLKSFFSEDSSQGDYTKAIQIKIDYEFKDIKENGVEKLKIFIGLRGEISDFEIEYGELFSIEGSSSNIYYNVSSSSYTLGSNIANTIDEWASGLPISDNIGLLTKLRGPFTMALSTRAPHLLALLSASMYFMTIFQGIENISFNLVTIYAVFSTVVFYVIMHVITLYFRVRYDKFVNKERSIAYFKFTNGDKVRTNDIEKNNNKARRSAAFSVAIALFINLAANIIMYFFSKNFLDNL